MNRIILSAIIATALARAAGAQSAPAPSTVAPQDTAATGDATTQTQSPKPFPAGTTIAIELSKSLDAKKAKAGDRIEARIPADVLAHGQIVIPRTARILGHVTEVKTRSKESPGSRVGVTFDRLVLKDGRELPVQMVVQAVSRPLQQVFASDSRLDGSAGMSGSASAGGMGGSMPPRSKERVAAIPIDAGSDASPPPATVAPLAATSHGVVGMKGLALKDSVVSSETDNVRLESGTQMILRVE